MSCKLEETYLDNMEPRGPRNGHYTNVKLAQVSQIGGRYLSFPFFRKMEPSTKNAYQFFLGVSTEIVGKAVQIGN